MKQEQSSDEFDLNEEKDYDSNLNHFSNKDKVSYNAIQLKTKVNLYNLIENTNMPNADFVVGENNYCPKNNFFLITITIIIIM